MTTLRRRPHASLLLPGALALMLSAGTVLAQDKAADAPATKAPDKEPANLPKSGYAVIRGKKDVVPAVRVGDAATVARIIDEGKNRNHVMEHITYLCNEIGPRLTGSTNQQKAAEWAKAQFEKWGLKAELWQWGTIPVRFDRGPSVGRVIAPAPRPRDADEDAPPTFRTVRELEFTTLAWSAGTNGPVRGPVVFMPRNEEEYKEVKDQLKGAWVLVQRPRSGARAGVGGRGGGVTVRSQTAKEARQKVAEGADASSLPFDQRVYLDGINGLISASTDDRVRTGGARDWRTMKPDDLPKDVEVVVRSIDYDYINSRLSDGDTVNVEFDLANTFTPGPIPVYDVVAEIPGTVHPEEVVVISAHMDSWNGPGSQGCTDNGTGTCVTLEAARILAASMVRPERTIRFILWSGEEQGLLGSRAYVKMLKEKGELDKVSACFVDDGGTNYEGGLKCLDSQVPILAAATAPVNGVFYSETDKKWLDVNIQPSLRAGGGMAGGSSDHASFQAEKIPGFFWDEVGRADYQFGWHTQNDKLTLAIPEYLQQSSTCAAVTAYNLACAPTLLPREAIKKPDPEKKDPEKKDGPATESGPSDMPH